MENKYIYWHTGPGCLAAVMSVSVVFLVSILALMYVPNSVVAVVISIGILLIGAYVPFHVDRKALDKRQRLIQGPSGADTDSRPQDG